MGLGCPQVCMDSSEWLQGIVHEEGDSDSLPPSGETITCSRPMTEKRLRPQHDQALKCPRCDSTHTKFCYYNNYSLSQPRYFCKACRRYWTKGGTLRNIPVGGGCRKNKRASTKKPNDQQLSQQPNLASHSAGTNLHLSFPELQLSHLTSILGRSGDLGGSNVLENNYNGMLENHRPIDFVETKFEATLGNSRIHDFMGNNHMGLLDGFGDTSHGFTSSDINSFSSPFGMSLDGNNGAFFDTYNRIMLPFEGNEDLNAIEMKPTSKLLSLDWQDQGYSGIGKDSIEQLNGLGSWTGMMNSFEQRQTH